MPYMAESQFVDKAILFAQLVEIVENQETGFLTILTNTKRSVLLRFSQGKLTRLHSRSNQASAAIHILIECTQVKYTYASAPEDDEAEVMPASSFLQLIDPHSSDVIPFDAGMRASRAKRAIADPVKLQLVEIATEYVGVVGEMIVDEAFEVKGEIGEIIEYICAAIPDENQAQAFREAAFEHFTSFKL